MPLRQSHPDGPGIRRVRAGRGFTYRDDDGRKVSDATRARITQLAIPPAWEDVWICPHPNGHIQATGVDARGRRQYRYHEAWHEQQGAVKHERVLELARQLPRLRARVREDLALDGMPRDRVLACAVRLLEVGCFRIGGEAYSAENGSFGLATLQKRHVKVRGDTVRFDYDAKSGQHRRCEVVDAQVLDVLRTLRRRRTSADDELLAYKDDDGAWVDVRSEDINGYIQEHLGQEFTSKDFRTWAGTVLAAVALATDDDATTAAERGRAVAAAARAVADHLGNTPAVARGSYIDPRVIDRFDADDTLEDPDDHQDLRSLEVEVIRLLERA